MQYVCVVSGTYLCVVVDMVMKESDIGHSSVLFHFDSSYTFLCISLCGFFHDN